MKNKKIVLISIITAIIIIGIIIALFIPEKDNIKFKKEYETYNNITINNNGKTTKYHEITIEKENPIIYLNDDNIIKELTTGDKIIYFGFPDCNACRMAVPLLLETAKENGVEEIYYYNFKNIRTKYEEGKDEKEIYKKIVKQLDKHIKETYKEGTIKGTKRLSAPTVILVKDGKVENYHNGTVKSHKDYSKKLTNTQKEELYQIYEDIMIDYIMCTSNC